MSEHKRRNIFVHGAIEPSFIASSIAGHAANTAIGGHSIFLGQVRADKVAGKQVVGIEYTAFEPMALQQMQTIRDAIFDSHDITCLHVYHSLGVVSTGSICLFVFASSPHRQAAIAACNQCVEAIKSQLPIWGKELLEGDTHQWKVNS